MSETLYDTMNRIALKEYGVEIQQLEDEDIWLYILERAERQAKRNLKPTQRRESYGEEKPQ